MYDRFEKVEVAAKIDITRVALPDEALPHILSQFSGQDVAACMLENFPRELGSLLENIPSSALEKHLLDRGDGVEIARRVTCCEIKNSEVA